MSVQEKIQQLAEKNDLDVLILPRIGISKEKDSALIVNELTNKLGLTTNDVNLFLTWYFLEVTRKHN